MTYLWVHYQSQSTLLHARCRGRGRPLHLPPPRTRQEAREDAAAPHAAVTFPADRRHSTLGQRWSMGARQYLVRWTTVPCPDDSTLYDSTDSTLYDSTLTGGACTSFGSHTSACACACACTQDGIIPRLHGRYGPSPSGSASVSGFTIPGEVGG